MLRLLMLAIIAVSVSATAASSAVPLRPAAAVHLVVPAYINGKGPFPVILDTGADNSVVYQWFAKKEGFKAGKMEDVGGMTGSRMMPIYKLDSVAVDGRMIRNAKADGMPNRHDVEIEVGAVGNDLMDGTVTVFDFPCKKVEIFAEPVNMQRLLTPGAHRIHAAGVRDGTQLAFPVQVNGARGIAVLDTGSSDTRINSAFVRAAGIDPSSVTFRDAEPIFGVSSHATPSKKGPIGTVTFGGIEVRGAEARLIDLPVFPSWGFGNGPAMIVGLDLLQGRRLIYDHKAKTIWFDVSTCAR